MIKRIFKKKKGLTLLELIIVLALMSIITMLVFSFTNLTQQKSKELQIRQKLQSEANKITESLMLNVLEAENIYEINLTADGAKTLNKVSFGVGKSEVSGISNVENVIYELDEDKKILKLKVKTQDSAEFKEIQEISSYVKEIEISSKEIVEKIKPDTKMLTHNDLDKFKNISLKFLLEDDYYKEKITHEHMIELNLRNAG